jgi:hypothetical protein
MVAVALAVLAEIPADPPAPRPARIRPAMLVWRIGTNDTAGPSGMIEAVTRATFRNRPTWRVTHYADDPAASTTNDFDLYDVDAETLVPLRSVMRNPGLSLELDFTKDEVTLRKKNETGTSIERIPLKTPVMPEGPGLRVFVASLPLKEGYAARFHSVDRWSGKEASRVKPMTLTVTGRRIVDTAMGKRDAFEVLIRPDDGSFRIAQRVRVEPPHYPFWMEYVRGTTTLVSEVTAMAIEPQSSSSRGESPRRFRGAPP